MWKGGRWLVRKSWRGQGLLGVRNGKGEERTQGGGDCDARQGKVQDLEAQVSVGRGLGRLETDRENFGQGGRGMGGNWQPSRNPL